MDDEWSLPALPVLKHAVAVHVSYGPDQFTLLCGRAKVVTASNPSHASFSAARPLLYAYGGRVDLKSLPVSLTADRWLIPVEYVTYIGLGPNIFTAQTPSDEPGMIVIVPSRPTALGVMSVDAIQATLSELSD
jgi:hypothetical protein